MASIYVVCIYIKVGYVDIVDIKIACECVCECYCVYIFRDFLSVFSKRSCLDVENCKRNSINETCKHSIFNFN